MITEPLKSVDRETTATTTDRSLRKSSGPPVHRPTLLPALHLRMYLDREFAIIPVPYKQKGPRIEGWQNLIVDRDNLTAHFPGKPTNIGVRLGKASNGLCDVDLDCEEAVKLAGHFLPTTPCRFGRSSKPLSHWLYRLREAPDSTQFRDLDRTMLLELRSNGLQTILPGSVHPSGERIAFDSGDIVPEPASVDSAQLVKAVRKLAAATILTRHYPAGGGRHEFVLSLAGALAHAGWAADDISSFVEAIATTTCDSEIPDRLRAVRDSAAKVAADNKATSWPTLAKILGDGVVSKVREWVSVESEWDEPGNIPAGLPDVQPFDYALLPEAVRPWNEDISDRMQCPPDYVAAATIVLAGALIGRQIGIRPKRHDDWTVVPNLYGGGVGPPSVMKSPAAREPLKFIQALEAEASKDYLQALNEHEAAELVVDATKKVQAEALKQAVKKGGDATKIAREMTADDTPEPTRRRYIVNNTTVEKLGEILAENPNGVLIFMDELIGLLRTMDREGHEADRAFYLTAWEGNSRYTYDRIGRGTVEIAAAIVSIFGLGSVSKHLFLPITLHNDMEVGNYETTRAHG